MFSLGEAFHWGRDYDWYSPNIPRGQQKYTRRHKGTYTVLPGGYNNNRNKTCPCGSGKKYKFCCLEGCV
jgi:uncharacterized protein YecA (UPF0149 family)